MRCRWLGMYVICIIFMYLLYLDYMRKISTRNFWLLLLRHTYVGTYALKLICSTLLNFKFRFDNSTRFRWLILKLC